ncbi:hypothetical protein AAVH_37245, partial [Aphelenchoides avenae]
ILFGREPCLPIDLRTKLFQEEQIQESGDGDAVAKKSGRKQKLTYNASPTR